MGAGATEDCHDSVSDQLVCAEVGCSLLKYGLYPSDEEAGADEVGATLDCQDSVLEKVV